VNCSPNVNIRRSSDEDLSPFHGRRCQHPSTAQSLDYIETAVAWQGRFERKSLRSLELRASALGGAGCGVAATASGLKSARTLSPCDACIYRSACPAGRSAGPDQSAAACYHTGLQSVGAWRSWLARFLDMEKVTGSSPVAPISNTTDIREIASSPGKSKISSDAFHPVPTSSVGYCAGKCAASDDPNLAIVIEAWPLLPTRSRRIIVGMARKTIAKTAH
jgi:hypothetical protein